MGDIVFLAHRVPYPPDRGDKIRGYHILRHLAARHRVHLIAFADDRRDLAGEAGLAPLTASRAIVWRSKSRLQAAAQALLRRKPVSLTAFDDGGVHAAVEAVLARETVDAIYVFSGQMAQYLPVSARFCTIMDFVDMDSAKFDAYGCASRGPIGWFLRREGRLLAAFEQQVAARVDASLFVSADEAALFRDHTGAARVHVLGNGIDLEFFDPAATVDRVDAEGPLTVFTGQMDYRPNIEGARWFAEQVLPRIRQDVPDARFAIVGRAPTAAVQALATRPGVTVTGEVADVRGWLAAAAVVVAPLQLARGVQNKVLEAMAMARPVVATSAAAQGIDHRDTIRVGESAADIARAVVVLLADPAAAARLGREARARVEDGYSWSAQLAPLDSLLTA